MTNVRTTANRIEELDYAKGLAIFLVIMGHATDNLATPLWRLTIYSFHMPLFFMVAGMVIKPAEIKERGTILEFLRKNFTALMVPYIIWALIYSWFSYENFASILYGTYEELCNAHSLTSLWFLPVLFLGRLWVELIFRALKSVTAQRQLWIAVMAVVCFAIGLIPPHPHPSTNTGFIGYPFGLDISFVATGYLLSGHLLLPVVRHLKKVRLPYIILGFFLSLGILACGTVLRAEDLGFSAMAFNNYDCMPFMFLDAFSGSIAILLLSVIMYRDSVWQSFIFNKKVLLFIGQNTIGIYLLHKNFMQEVVMGSFTRWGWTEPQVLVAFVSALITLTVACIGVKIIKRYIPQLLGTFPR